MSFKVIICFNHKGGVSKTTSNFNLGWKLSQLGKKVLFVDGDSQCNLTGLFLGDSFESYYEDESTKNHNIRDAVKVAFDGKPKPIEAINCFSPPHNSNIFLIPGHMDLSEYDPSLSFALNSSNSLTTLQNLPGSFYQLINLTAEKYNIDYVFIDMNPGLSSLNQTFFMFADVFIVPINLDPFSIMALKTLKNILPRWKRWAEESREVFQDASYPLPKKDMKFLGEVVQRFNVRNQKPAAAYQAKIEEIRSYIENDFVPDLKKSDMVCDISNLVASKLISDHMLAEIPDFGSLILAANKHSIPIFCLDAKQTEYSGNVLKTSLENRDKFNLIYENLAKIILES